VPRETPYNTKVVLRPTDDLTFYGRTTGNGTYLLETILVEGS